MNAALTRDEQPLPSPAVFVQPPAPRPATEGLYRMDVRVLIVDDEEPFRRSLAEQLARPGFEVATAPDGRQAVEQVRQRDFDVVLLDVLMPGLDGVQTLEQIKRLRPLTEVIFLTGHAGLESAVEALEKGAFDYVMKPASPDDLLLRIKSACETRQLNQHLGQAR